MLAILTNWKGTTETNAFNFCPEYELVTKNYGMRKYHQRHLRLKKMHHSVSVEFRIRLTKRNQIFSRFTFTFS